MSSSLGYKGRVVLDFETAFKTEPGVPAGLIMPVKSFNLKSNRPKNSSQVITGTRNPVKPFDGNLVVNGNAEIPVDASGFPYWLKAMFGAPTTTQKASQNLDTAAAVDKGSGLVGIPCTGHGYLAGQTVTLAGTTNYDGDEVIASVTENEFVITATYISETFDGTETVQAKLYDHVFKVGDTAPSLVAETRYQSKSGIVTYAKGNGVKVSTFGFEVGGDDELLANLSLEGATETLSGTPYDSSPTSISMIRFNNYQAALVEGGSALANATAMDININFGLDTDIYVMGGGGVRGDLPEGILEVTGSVTTLFENTTLLDKAINSTETSLVLTFTSAFYSLSLAFNELQFERNTPGIEGPKGILLNLPFVAYMDDDAAASVVVATLTNEVASYA